MSIKDLEDKLYSYIDAIRPIIYINHFDFKAIDDVIRNISKGINVFEYNNAYGLIDFNNKTEQIELDLLSFLKLIKSEAFEKPVYILLKDIHDELRDIKVISAIKDIVEKNMYLDNYYATIFIVSSKLNIPVELENYITIVDMPSPSLNEIENIIRKYCQDLNVFIPDEEISELAIDLKGLSEFQIIQILNLAYQDGGKISINDKHLILEEKKQIIKKSGILEIINFKESIEDIGGLEVLKEWLIKKEKIFNKLDKAIKYGVDIPKGVLVVGMPGCGKSLTAKAAAKLFNIPLLRLDVGRLLGKYVGESETNLRNALKMAETISPCVLWIDEIEKAFAGVGQNVGSSDITTRLFGQFLTWMQEKENTVFTIATANDISTIPAEFLRKGRFDEIFFVDLPKDEEIKKIFEIHLKKRKKWSNKIDTIKLSKLTKGYSGADIESVIKEVVENSFIDNKKEVTTEDIVKVINNTKSISVTLKDKIDKIRKILNDYDIKLANLSK